MKKDKKGVIQLITFSAIGIFNTLLDYILFWIFIKYIHIDKNISQVLSYTIATGSSFLMNKRWTFSKKGRFNPRYVVKFAIVNCCSLMLSIALINVFYYELEIHMLANYMLESAGINLYFVEKKAIMFAKFASSPFTFLFNFFCDKSFVFKEKKKS